MKPEELIQLLRTLNVAQIRKQLEEDHEKGNVRYDHFVSFVLAASMQSRET